MVNSNSFLEAKWHEKNKHKAHNKQISGMKRISTKPTTNSGIRAKTMGRHQKRHHKSNFCKDRSRGKNRIGFEDVSGKSDKIGHVAKACPIKAKDKESYLQGKTVGYEEGSRDVNNLTQAKINKNRDLVMCFKCQRQGHFANRCPTRKFVASTKEPVQPKVSIKYPEFIHFKTRGILKGTDYGTWDDFWNIDVDKIRQRHNDYLDDYFESLYKERTDRKEEEPGIVEDTNTLVVQTFQEYVAFLNLVKDDEETSKECDTYRDSQGTENPITGEEDMERLEEYQWNLGKNDASSAVEKGKERRALWDQVRGRRRKQATTTCIPLERSTDQMLQMSRPWTLSN
nr:hypothetical protein [Tanacetum cinerariifolium]